MGLVKVAGVVCVVLTAQVFAASTVDYTVELSPYNSTYVANYKAGGTARTYFTADGTFGGASLGSAADGQQFAAGSVLTWDLKAAVSGVHSQAGHASDGKPVAGLANLVFNLQLERLNGTNWELVSLGSGSAGVQGWYSAINDGTGGSPVAPAAMALSYNIGNLGPGRAVDPWNDYNSSTPDGGPKLGLFTYPTLVAGKLLGQGCGYTAWDRSGAYQNMTSPGVGMATITRPSGATAAGLGIKPICEGQINTAGLAAGTYRLKVTPGAGVNVLRGDIDLYAISTPSFAVAANVVNEDTITFQLVTVGSLEVTILPAEAVTAGAQYAVDGGAWQNPGTTALLPGTHTVSYKSIAGWSKPADANVEIVGGSTTSTTGVYAIPTGSLTVALNPAAAVAAGAQWRVDGGAYQASGTTLTGLTTGSHVVSFKPVAGYATPANQNVNITTGGNTQTQGYYDAAPDATIDMTAWSGFTRSVDYGQNASSDTFDVWNATVVGVMDYSVVSNVGWMTASVTPPGDGLIVDDEIESIHVTYATDALAPGVHNGTITINSSVAVNAPLTIPVQVTVGNPPGCSTAPVIVSATSRKLHGGVSYDIPFINPATLAPFSVVNPGGETGASVECRSNGVTQVIVKFNQSVVSMAGGANPAVGSEIVVTCTASSGQVALGAITAAITDDVLTINIPNMPAAATGGSCLSVLLHNFACTPNALPAGVMADTSLGIQIVRGDVNASGDTGPGDINAVKASSGVADITASPLLFRRDLNGDGSVGPGDINLAKASSGFVGLACP